MRYRVRPDEKGVVGSFISFVYSVLVTSATIITANVAIYCVYRILLYQFRAVRDQCFQF